MNDIRGSEKEAGEEDDHRGGRRDDCSTRSRNRANPTGLSGVRHHDAPDGDGLKGVVYGGLEAEDGSAWWVDDGALVAASVSDGDGQEVVAAASAVI